MTAPTRGEVLEALRDFRVEYFKARTACDTYVMVAMDSTALDRAVAYLENDPAEELAANYAARMDRVADTWDEGAKDRARFTKAQRFGLHGRAEGLREAARLLRDKDTR